MTALQNTFSSTILYPPSAVRSGSNVKPQTDSQQIATNTDTPLDFVTISTEGLEAYQKIENAQLDQQQQSIDFESLISTMPKGGELKPLLMEEHSKHFSVVAWALEIDTTGMSYKEANKVLFSNQSAIANFRSQTQATTEKLDEKITDILKSNNIVLDDKETLNLTVNEKGEIIVGKGISNDKRAALEKLLNEDKTLGQDLLFSHAQRQIANFYLTGGSDKNTRQILADSLLQREFGISLSDLEQVRPDETNKTVGLSIRSKDGNYDNILETLYEEELATFTFIESVLNDQTETVAEKGTAGFEYSYSYKNGITIEKGETDQAGIDKMSDRFLNREASLVTLYGEDAIDYSVTIDTSGKILDTKINAVKGITDKSVLAEINRRWSDYIASAPANADDYWVNPFLSDITLQQFAFDTQRLYRFNSGVSKEQAQSMNITFGSSGVSDTNTDTDKILREESKISESKNSEQSITHETTTPRLFSNSPNSADNLIRFFELDTINANNATLSGSLEWSFESEKQELTDILNVLLKEVGFDNETEEMIFAEDKDGNIIIEGNIDNTKKKQLTEAINSNKELVEQIKNQKAIMEMIRGLDPETHSDISSDEFMEARTQILNRFLATKTGVSLDDIIPQNMDDGSVSMLVQQKNKDNNVIDNQLQLLFDQIPGLKEELVHYAATKPLNVSGGETRYLLKMKQGVLLESQMI